MHIIKLYNLLNTFVNDVKYSIISYKVVTFGKVYDKKWYVEFEVKYISSIDETIDEYPKIGIMYGNNPCHYDDNVSTSSYYYLDYTYYGVKGEWHRFGFVKSVNNRFDWSNSTTYNLDKYFYVNKYYKVGMLRNDNSYYLY